MWEKHPGRYDRQLLLPLFTLTIELYNPCLSIRVERGSQYSMALLSFFWCHTVKWLTHALRMREFVTECCPYLQDRIGEAKLKNARSLKKSWSKATSKQCPSCASSRFNRGIMLIIILLSQDYIRVGSAEGRALCRGLGCPQKFPFPLAAAGCESLGIEYTIMSSHLHWRIYSWKSMDIIFHSVPGISTRVLIPLARRYGQRETSKT